MMTRALAGAFFYFLASIAMEAMGFVEKGNKQSLVIAFSLYLLWLKFGWRDEKEWGGRGL